MTKWVTRFEAIDPDDGQLKEWVGPFVEAPSQALAQAWCRQHAGHLVVIGRLAATCPLAPGPVTDYETETLN